MRLLGLFEPLTMESKAVINRYLRAFPPQVSELTFENLWFWGMCHPVWWCEEKGNLYLIERGHRGFFGFVPLGPDPLEVRVKRLEEMMRTFDLPFRMERVACEEGRVLTNSGYKAESDRDHFDYLYSREQLADLKGRKLSRKRNHIAQCLKRYSCEYVPFTQDMIPACKGFLEEWCKIRGCAENPDLCCEHRAIRFLLYDYQHFDVLGGTIRVNGEIAAVTFGQKLNQDTAVIHFEKAHPEMEGMYALINQWFCREALEAFQWVNREQDLGSPGLRKAKQSYYPTRMIEKCIVTSGMTEPPSVENLSRA